MGRLLAVPASMSPTQIQSSPRYLVMRRYEPWQLLWNEASPWREYSRHISLPGDLASDRLVAPDQEQVP
jgi:hypothetical protein